MLFFVLKTDFAWAKGQWKNIMATLVLASCCETKWSPIWKIRGTPKCNFEVSSLGCIFARVLLVDKMFLQVRQPGRELTTLPTYLTSHCILIFFFSSFNSFFLFTMHTLYISTLHKDKGMRSMKCTSKILQKERKKWRCKKWKKLVHLSHDITKFFLCIKYSHLEHFDKSRPLTWIAKVDIIIFFQSLKSYWTLFCSLQIKIHYLEVHHHAWYHGSWFEDFLSTDKSFKDCSRGRNWYNMRLKNLDPQFWLFCP